jgi:hypothetical protein
MPNNKHKRLTAIETLVVDLSSDAAIGKARSVPREAFAETLLDNLPSPRPGTVALDLDQLTTSELWELARMDNPCWPELSALPIAQVQRLAAGEPPAQVMQEGC